MTKQEKQMFRYTIVKNDTISGFDFTKGFFEMDSYHLTKLDMYAEIFNIKSDNYGRSRARVLWKQLLRANEKYLKIK